MNVSHNMFLVEDIQTLRGGTSLAAFDVLRESARWKQALILSDELTSLRGLQDIIDRESSIGSGLAEWMTK
jgi:hypothetical protein